MPDVTSAFKDRLWVLRYKLGSQPPETAIIEARNQEYAERIGRKWCDSKGDGLRQCRFIGVKAFIAADESILTETTFKKPEFGPPLPAPTRQ